MEATGGQILIADDEPQLLKMISSYLVRRGYHVTTVETAEDAWNAIQGSPEDFSLAVLDATMRGLGLEELALKMLALNPVLCVIAASGYPVDMTAMEAAAPGRVMFLHKPFAPEMLANAVRRMLGSQEKDV